MKYTMYYSIKSPNPESPDLSMVAGETEAATPYEASKKLEPNLIARIGNKHQDRLVSATIREPNGREAAILQIDKVAVIGKPGVTKNSPRWGAWLTFR